MAGFDDIVEISRTDLSFFKNVLLFYSLSQILILTGNCQLEYHYVGCFYDNSDQSSSLSRSFFSGKQSVSSCITECVKQPNTDYARLQNGNACYCVNDYDVQLRDDVCRQTCDGNQSEYCGGNANNHSAYVIYTVCPAGSYGTACDQVCHCKRQIPCNRRTGECPDGCHGNYTGQKCDEINKSEQYIGCFRDMNNDRALTNRFDPGLQNSWTYCTNNCATKTSSSYAGLEFGAECYCGENYSKHGQLKEDNCSKTCPGYKSEICGGEGAMSIYSTCPAGHYGKSCIRICNCVNNGRCVYANGSCPESAGCAPGWTGRSCNNRDCRVQNGNCLSNEVCSTVDLKFTNITVCRCTPGYKQSKMLGKCTDVNECIETPMICGPFGVNCSNTEGGYKCLCQNGNTVVNQTCSAEETRTGNNTGTIVGVVVGIVLGLAAIAAIAFVFVFLHRRKKIKNRSRPVELETSQANCAPYVSSRDFDRATYVQAAELYSASSSNSRPIDVQQLPDVIRYKLSTHGVLEKEFKRVPMEGKDPSNVGKNRDLKKKNRFKNIIPYDNNRVILSLLNGDRLSDYINASYVDGYATSDKFIATQGPRAETVGDFWRMIFEQNVGVIVMITDLMENKKVKCEKYWPDLKKVNEHNDITIKTTSEEIWSNYTFRKFQASKQSQNIEVHQWHFLGWPDHGVPTDTGSFMKFRRKVRKSMSPEKCTVVHCSAGAGRTGCFIGIDYLLEQGNAEGQVDILACLQFLRKQRSQMIQNLEQYRYVHLALLEEYTIGDTSIPCDAFSSVFQKLQRKDPEGKTKLDVQLHHCLEETKEKQTERTKHRVATKSIPKNRAEELDAVFVQGWKKKEVFMSVKFSSTSSVIDDFYALCREQKCTVIVFFDPEPDARHSFFSTDDNYTTDLRSSTVVCDTAANDYYGTYYKITEQKLSNETYANTAVYQNVGADTERRYLHIFHVTKSMTQESVDYRCLNALHSDVRIFQPGTSQNQSPIVVISRTGYLLSGFCIAAFNAFDMARVENEVDIYQIVQDIRKSRSQFSFSLSSYKELHVAVGQYIENMVPDNPYTN